MPLNSARDGDSTSIQKITLLPHKYEKMQNRSRHLVEMKSLMHRFISEVLFCVEQNCLGIVLGYENAIKLMLKNDPLLFHKRLLPFL